MKRKQYLLSLLTAVVALSMALTGCYSDEVNDLQKSIDDLKASQSAQAELIDALETVRDLKEAGVKVWDVRSTGEGQPVAVADLTDGRLLAVTNGGLTLFSESEGGKVVIDGNETALDWKNPLNLEICPKGVWVVNGKGADVTAPKFVKGAKPYAIKANGNGYALTLSNGGVHMLGKNIGLLYLAEGSMGKDNGELEFFSYNPEKDKYDYNDAFRKKGYGETPNAMIAYGSKIYVAISGVQGKNNGAVRVLDRAGRLIEEVKLSSDNGSLMPRALVAHEGMVYVSAYLDPVKADFSYVAKLDTMEYKPKYAKITGAHSEGLAISGSELFICQSGQGKDNKIAVVDLGTFAEKEVITVGYNPVHIVSDGKGTLYFTTMDVYGADWSITTPSNLYKLDAASRKVVKTYDVRTGTLALHNGVLYVTTITNWNDGSSQIKTVNLADDTVSNFATRLPKYMFAAKIAAFDDERQELYITQSMGSQIFRFSYDGKSVGKLRAKQQNGASIILIR